MHRLVPDFILERFARDEHSGRFEAAALFVDIAGFSDITDTLMNQGQRGAEVLADIISDIFGPLIGAVYAHDGFVVTLAGDAFTAVFRGAASDDASRRALAAARQMQAQMAGRAAFETPYGRFAVTVKIGLDQGEVAWGIIQAQDRGRAIFYFQGTAIDGCAAAEHRSPAGAIVLGPAAREALGNQIEVQPLDGDGQTHVRLQAITGPMPGPRPVSMPPLDLELASRFFPRELITQAGDGEFRQMVYLFVSLPTVRTEAQLAIFMQTVFALQTRYGGLLNRLDFGDKGSNLLLFWGAPRAFENDVERALNFILDLQARTSIPISAGVTYQIGHASFSGSPLREEYTAYGRGANLAARLMMAAPDGEIWLDEAMARRSVARFETDFEGVHSYKGFAEPQKVFVLLERKEAGDAITRRPLIGRDDELRQLMDFVAPLWQGRPAGGFLIWGEPGIGKSHLVQAFRGQDLFERQPVLWAQCQSDEIVRQSLNPLRYWLMRYYGQSVEQSEARNKRNFNRRLQELIAATTDRSLADELDRSRSFLGALVDLSWPDSLYEQLDAQGRYENTMAALISLIKAESRLQPVILWLEDAHWVDEDTAAFLARLARSLTADDRQHYPVAVVATARPTGPAGALPDGDAWLHINLSRLDDDRLAELVATVLSGPAGPGLQGLLIRRAEGNPFFAEQIVRYMQDRELLHQTARGWEPVGSTAPLPTDVRAILIARLDRLELETRLLVQTAAVLGREFELPLLAHMLSGDVAFAAKVEAAEAAGVWARISDSRLQFRHALMHEAAYRMQPHSWRRAVHGRVVMAMEDLYAGDLRRHYPELAYHSEQAQIVDRAREYLRLAGDAASNAYQHGPAVDFYTRALDLTPEADSQDRYELLLAREATYRRQGKQSERLEDLEAMVRLVEQMDEGRYRAELAMRQTSFALDSSDYAQAIEAAVATIELARENNLIPLVVGGHRFQALALLRQGKLPAAIEEAETGLELAQEIGYQRGESQLLNILGLIRLEQRDFSQARSDLEQSLAIARAIGQKRPQANTLNNLGILAGYVDDYPGARVYYREALSLAREMGDLRGEGLVLGNLGWIAGLMGEYGAAREHAEENLRLAREAGDRYSEMYGLINLSSYAGALGDQEQAENSAASARDLARETDDLSGEAWALTNLGHSLMLGNRPAEAQATYQQALSLRHRQDQPLLAIEPAAGLAQAALATGDRATARVQVETILTYLVDGPPPGLDDPSRVYLACYQVLEADQDPRAPAVLNQAHDWLVGRSTGISDTTARRQFLEDVPVNRALRIAWQQHTARTTDRSAHH